MMILYKHCIHIVSPIIIIFLCSYLIYIFFFVQTCSTNLPCTASYSLWFSHVFFFHLLLSKQQVCIEKKIKLFICIWNQPLSLLFFLLSSLINISFFHFFLQEDFCQRMTNPHQCKLH